jgi:hypothetical protein
LREAAPILKYPLCKLFNMSMSLSSFPFEWKLANVTPVSLISIVGKVMARYVYKLI